MTTGSSGKMARFLPLSLRGYQRSWLRTDILAGLTLAAVAIPESMGYTSIAQVPVVTGLYTLIFPTLVFALLASSRLLVVGADSATAAVLAAGLASLGIAGLTPESPKWLAFSSLVALVCGAMLVVARLLRLGFLGDFLSSSVLIGFLTGVGIQVFAGQLPDMLGIEKGTGNWFQQQWWTITHLVDANLPTVAFAAGTLAIILGSAAVTALAKGIATWLAREHAARIRLKRTTSTGQVIEVTVEGRATGRTESIVRDFLTENGSGT